MGNKAKQFFYAVFERRVWFMKSFKQHIKPLKGKDSLDRYDIISKVRTLEDVAANGDLKQWAEWALNCDEYEFFSS